MYLESILISYQHQLKNLPRLNPEFLTGHYYLHPLQDKVRLKLHKNLVLSAIQNIYIFYALSQYPPTRSQHSMESGLMYSKRKLPAQKKTLYQNTSET